MLLFSVVALLSAPAVHAEAPPATPIDWRLNRAAFRSAEVDTRVYPSKRISSANLVVITPDDLAATLKVLSGGVSATVGGTEVKIAERGSEPNRELARKWLTENYAALGFKTSRHSYSGGANVVAEFPGAAGGKVLILSSHFDSVYNAGANDDGTGTVANLVIARALAPILKANPPKNTLRIVAFDEEERGLVGSHAYVKDLKAADIVGDIQMEMMSYNGKKDGRFHVIDCDRKESTFLTAAIMSTITAMKLPLTRVKACEPGSDHGAFWGAKMPAVCLSENFFGGDGDPCYHASCDVMDKRLDFDYSARIASAVATTILDLLGTN